MQFALSSSDWAKLRLSPDGSRLLGSWRDDVTERSILNGRELPAVEWKRGASPACRWNPELSHRAAVERVGAAAYVVVSDVAGETRLGPFEDVKIWPDCFGTPGHRLMFTFTRGGAAWVWIDGEELGPFAGVEAPRWLGRTPTFVIRTDAGRHLWLGGRTLGPFEVVWSVVLTDDGTVGVCGQDGGAHFILHGERRYGPFEQRPSFTLDAQGQQVLRIGQQEFGPFSLGESARRASYEKGAFSADGAHFAFLYELQGATYVRRDAGVLGPYGRRASFTLSPTGLLTVATLDEESLLASLVSLPG